MQFTFNKEAWTTIEEGEKNCYLLTNGLGGFHSLSVIGAAARGDQAFLMAAKKAPNVRWHMITNLFETIYIDGNEYVLTSQRMKDKEDFEGYQYLESFTYENLPKWTFRIEDVTVEKTILMVQEENTVAVRYQIKQENGKNIKLEVKPLLRFTAKNTPFAEENGRKIQLVKMTRLNQETKELQEQYGISNEDAVIYFATNGNVTEVEPSVFGPMYFSQDERDGRDSEGCTLINHSVVYEVNKEDEGLTCVYSMKPYTYKAGLFDELLYVQKQQND